MLFSSATRGRRSTLTSNVGGRRAVGVTHIVGARVPLLPLNQEELCHHECGDEDEDHLGVHRLVPTVLGMHPYVLHPATTRKRPLKSTPAQTACWGTNTSGEPGRPDGKAALRRIVFVDNPEGKEQKAALGPAHFSAVKAKNNTLSI